MMRPATMLFVLLAGALSLALFAVKSEVQDVEEELADLNRAIIADRQAIHVLEAEWSHLNNPARLRSLARRHLGLAPLEPEQLGVLAGLPESSERGAGSAPPAPDAAPGRSPAPAEERR